MNREILFRGQTRRKGEKVRLDGSPVPSNWVYGGILPNSNGGDFAVIYQQEPEFEKFPVHADTVCQYTGLTDENGKKIFEGDIVKYDFGEEQIGVQLAVVQYDAQYHGFLTKPVNDWMYAQLKDCEVIGNIFDNPELLDKAGEPNGKS